MKNGPIYGLYGAGGFAREVMGPWAEALASAGESGQEPPELYFIETEPSRREVNGLPVLSESEFLAMSPGREKRFNIAIADSEARMGLAERCIAGGASPITINISGSRVSDSNELRPGAILCAGALVTANARIGRFFHANLNAYVAHDCVVGDFVTFAPNVCCNGNVRIGDHAYIGTGALLRPGVTIGERAIVGMGAVVVADVASGATVMGNPARPRTT